MTTLRTPYRDLEIRGEVVRVEEDPDIDFIAMEKTGDGRVVVSVKPGHTTRTGE